MADINHPMLRLDTFEPSRQAGLARLDAFVPFAGRHYAQHRNTDDGPQGQVGVSGLSPYLRYRLVTEAEVIKAVLEQHPVEVAEKFIQEVVWRSYWKGWLQLRPRVWTDYLAECGTGEQRLGSDSEMRCLYESAIQGNAGISGFDDWAKDLVRTGYLHNHARMWFASIWIFTLRLPWALGAAFFLRHLIDGDPASNTLSWRWVAGIQTPGKTYLATTANIKRFTNGRYAPTGLASQAHAISATPAPAAEILVPRMDIDQALNKTSVCLVHHDDIALADIYRAHTNCKAVVWWYPNKNEDASLGERAHGFVKEAMDHSMNEGERRLSTTDLETLDALLNEVGANQLIVSEPPVGCACPELDAICQHPLCVLVRRRYDDTLWPLATKGFFPFKEKVLGTPPLIKTIV